MMTEEKVTLSGELVPANSSNELFLEQLEIGGYSALHPVHSILDLKKGSYMCK